VAEPLNVAPSVGTVWSGPAFTTGAWFGGGVGVGVGVGVGLGGGVGGGAVSLIWTNFATEGTPSEFRINTM
jgi:hypothetical protein